MRLREYYDVHYYEGILDFETGIFDEVVRIFPTEKFDTTKTKINLERNKSVNKNVYTSFSF